MNAFHYRKGVLHAEGVSLQAVAKRFGTPTYAYSGTALASAFRQLDEAFSGVEHLICYSVKANSHLAILERFSELGSGFDVVSGGELARVLKVGGSAKKTVFAGVGKTRDEMARALSAGILLFNVESAEELDALDSAAREQGKRAPIALRVNPHVDARTHRYIATGLQTSKFGIPFKEAAQLYAKAKRMRGVEPLGIDFHIGSQLTDLAPIAEATSRVAEFYRTLVSQGLPLRYLDVGGGLGISYGKEKPPTVQAYARVVRRAAAQTGAMLLLEPGRSLVGAAGVLLTQVLYRKQSPHKRFVVVDAGMNDLIRPALYEAHHGILPVRRTRGTSQTVDVVGPVCESSDVLASGRRVVIPKVGALWAIENVGAYGMSMASTYNSRPRPAEVWVDGARMTVIRERERIEDLWRGEKRLVNV
ncbi:MAG: diaminopimelate decarboxylase [Myxococcaceae bacterium]